MLYLYAYVLSYICIDPSAMERHQGDSPAPEEAQMPWPSAVPRCLAQVLLQRWVWMGGG